MISEYAVAKVALGPFSEPPAPSATCASSLATLKVNGWFRGRRRGGRAQGHWTRPQGQKKLWMTMTAQIPLDVEF